MQKSTVVSGAKWNLAERLLANLVKLGVFVVLARLITPSSFGIVSLATTFVTILELFLDQGLSHFLIYYKSLRRIHLNTVFWFGIFISIILISFTFIISGFIAEFYKEPLLEDVIDSLSIVLIVASLSTIPKTLLQKELLFKKLAIRSFFSSGLSGLIAVYMAYSGYGVWSLVALTISLRVIDVILLWYITKWKPDLQFSFYHVREMIPFGLSNLGVKVLKLSDKNIADILIGYFLGSSLLGYYTVAFRIVRMTSTLLTSVLTTVSFPFFAKMQNDSQKLKEYFKLILKYSSLLIWPIFIYLGIFSDSIVLIFGEKWVSSKECMMLLSFGSILFSTTQLSGSLAWGLGQYKLNLRYSIIITISNLILYLIASRISIEAVAIAFIVSNSLVFTPLQVSIAKKLLGISLIEYLEILFIPLLYSILFAFIVFVLKVALQKVGIDSYLYILGISLILTALFYLVLFLNNEKALKKIIKK